MHVITDNGNGVKFMVNVFGVTSVDVYKTCVDHIH